MNCIQIHWTRSILLAGATWLLATSAQAVGLGVYLEYLPAGGYLEDPPVEYDYDTNKVGVGFVLDTNVAKDQIFNYRFNLGYQHSKREYDFGFKEKYNGVTMNHAFGFALYTNPSLRLWAGPAIRLGVDVLDEDMVDVSVFNFSAGGGPQVGLNWHVGDRVSIALSAAYQYLYVGQFWVYEDDYDDYDTEDYDGGQHLGTLNLTFFFRSAGDRYRRPRSDQATME
jgi:hypothetical protein